MSSMEVGQLFAGVARECTPAGMSSLVTVLFAPQQAGIADACSNVLSDAERRRAESFLTEDLKSHFVQQRAFRHYCGALATPASSPLSRIDFKTTDKGRPYLAELPGCWFSFSSCRHGFLGAWSSTQCIGVDIEDQAGSVEAVELAREYFRPAEAQAVEHAGHQRGERTFLELWTLKEAALKSIGEGLPFGLDAFQFDLTAAVRVVDAPRAYGGPARFEVYPLEIEGCCAALAMRRRADPQFKPRAPSHSGYQARG